MITKSYYIEDTTLAAKAIAALEMAIPCFTNIEMLGDGFLCFTIEFREYDIRTVEKYLAPIV